MQTPSPEATATMPPAEISSSEPLAEPEPFAQEPDIEQTIFEPVEEEAPFPDASSTDGEGSLDRAIPLVDSIPAVEPTQEPVLTDTTGPDIPVEEGVLPKTDAAIPSPADQPGSPSDGVPQLALVGGEEGKVEPESIAIIEAPITPEQPTEPGVETEKEPAPESGAAQAATVAPIPFDPKQVSEALKTATIVNVRIFVDTLNSIIRARNFEAWKRNLTKEYIEYYSNSIVLATLSESSVLQRMKITLRSLYDYFIYVVYPSRQNVRVDDIDFIRENRIVVISLNSKGERLVLYDLEKVDDSWAIGTGR
jgi:hypothetical protein